MKILFFALSTLVICATVSAVDRMDKDQKRSTRHFLYEVVSKGASIRVSDDYKKLYLDLMQEHLAYVQGKLDMLQARKKGTTDTKQVCTSGLGIKAMICAACSTVCASCVNTGYKVINGCLCQLRDEQDSLTDEVARLNALLEIAQRQSRPASIVTTVKQRFEHWLVAVEGDSDSEQDASNTQITPSLNSNETKLPSVGATLVYTMASAWAAYYAAKHAYGYISKMVHAEDHLIETIEKDKAVIAMLESLE